MKKLFFIFSVLTVVALGSCNQSYYCTCIFTTTTGVSDTTYPATKASSQSAAKSNCQAMSGTSGTGTVEACDLR